MAVRKGDETRRKMMEYIKGFFGEHGYAPSYREIGEAIGVKSSSSVAHHMLILFRDGYLETDAEIGTPRAFRIKC